MKKILAPESPRWPLLCYQFPPLSWNLLKTMTRGGGDLAGLLVASNPEDSEDSPALLRANRGWVLPGWLLPSPPPATQLACAESQPPRQMARGGCKGLLDPQTTRLSHQSEQTGRGVEGALRGHDRSIFTLGRPEASSEWTLTRRAFQAGAEVLATPGEAAKGAAGSTYNRPPAPRG